MSIFTPQNPGIGGLNELTPAEEVFLTTLAGLSFNEGDYLTIVSGSPAWAALNLSGYVPYTGATTNVDLGSHNLELTNIQINGTYNNYNSNLYDIGSVQNSDLRGYGLDYITDKSLNNVTVGSNGTASNGGMRVTTAGVFQMYLNGSWNNVVTNFVLREDSTFGYTLEHAPIGFTQYIEIMTGQSLSNLGLNGYPITNAYKTSQGAYPPVPVIGGYQYV